jgi:beta-mannosidase
MGCSVYPQDKVFIDAIEKEAIYLVKGLRNHPALVVWAGDNENDLACYNWNGFERNPNHNIITRDVLPAVIRMHDYTRAYLPSSPYMSEAAYQKKGNMPEKHLWGPRDYFKGAYYKDAVCRFASEIGYHGFPSTASLKKFLKNPDVIFRDDGIATDEYLVHAAGMETAANAPFAYRIRLAVDQVETLFGHKESNFSDFIKQSQISQAEADKFFIENFRVKKWKRTGIIWWNLLDGWPQISDAVVDYYFIKKLAYHFIKRSQAPVCLIMGEPVDSVLTLYGVNDLPENVEVFYSVKKVNPGNGFETIQEGYAELTGETSSEIGRLSCKPDEQTFYLIEWEVGDKKYKNHYFTNLLNIEYQAYYESLKMCGMDQFEGMDD